MYLELNNISKYYGKNKVLENFDLQIEKNDLICLLGPSGCGKTTVLNCIGGFIKLNGGEIILDNENITNLPPENREISTVFQSYGLFPHMNVEENIKYGLKFKNISKKEATKMATDILSIVKLNGYNKKRIDELSGGERQRVALARSLVVKPKVLLLDEPLSNLDAILRIELRSEIKRLHEELNLTTIMVTHDQEEAFSIGSKIVLMDKGKISSAGTAEEIYFNPTNEFSLKFIGSSNILDLNGEKYYIRPENIHIERLENNYNAEIIEKSFIGSSIIYKVKENENIFTVTTLNNKDYNIGDKVFIKYILEKLKEN